MTGQTLAFTEGQLERLARHLSAASSSCPVPVLPKDFLSSTAIPKIMWNSIRYIASLKETANGQNYMPIVDLCTKAMPSVSTGVVRGDGVTKTLFLVSVSTLFLILPKQPLFVVVGEKSWLKVAIICR